ncbi:PaaI family thioesterase [candidate division CSSED10-310 bacterium]|uniref:PaaI family thioesterase n=1 Tax=candidate division CSSED10-310 bacterium TaxID=2855610 RepID=A0ABV6YS49_UNCC1
MNPKEAFQAFLYNSIPLIKKLGISIETLDKESVTTRLPAADFNKNHVNTVYAGIQFTMMEVTGGIIFASTFDINKYFMVILSMNIEYHKPAKGELICSCSFSEADRVALMAELDEQGKARTTLSMELKDKADITVASAQATYYISLRK